MKGHNALHTGDKKIDDRGLVARDPMATRVHSRMLLVSLDLNWFIPLNAIQLALPQHNLMMESLYM